MSKRAARREVLRFMARERVNERWYFWRWQGRIEEIAWPAERPPERVEVKISLQGELFGPSLCERQA